MYIPQDDINQWIEDTYDPRDKSALCFYRDPRTLIYYSIGVVDDIHDPDKLGRVRVFLPMLGEKAISDWVQLAQTYRSTDAGTWVYPEVGESVLIIHYMCVPHMPIVLGSFYTLKMKPNEAIASKPKNKVIMTKGGLKVEMNEEETYIALSCLEGKMRLVISDDGIDMTNEEGDIEIKCDGKLTLEAGDLAVETEKDITVKADELMLESTKGMKLKAASGQDQEWKSSGKIKLKGNTGVCAGGKQIAVCGDQVVGVDMHTIMIPSSSGLAPLPGIPHPYLGKLKDKLSENVMVGGQKAATKGSKAKYDTPGYFPMPPGVQFQKSPNNEAEITGGTCPKVLINGKEACTLTSQATSCNDMGMQNHSTVIAVGAAVVLPIMMPCADPASFERDGGFMFNTRDPISKTDPNEPDKHPKLTSPQWGSSTAKVGEEVTLSVSTTDLYENATVYFTIWADGADRTKDEPVKKVLGTNVGGKAEATWTWFYRPEEWPEPFTAKPKFVFTADSFKCAQVESSGVEMGDELSITVYKPDGSKATNSKYIAILPDRSRREGATDTNGKIELKDLPPGIIDIEINDLKDFSLEHHEGS